MTRPVGAEWSVLDRDEDPIPGDPAVINEIRSAYETLASVTQEAHDLLVSGSEIDGGQGAAMEAFRDLIGELPRRLRGMADSYRQAAQTLQGFEPSLVEAQALSLQALEQARDAQAAQATMASVVAGAEAAMSTAQTAMTAIAAATESAATTGTTAGTTDAAGSTDAAATPGSGGTAAGGDTTGDAAAALERARSEVAAARNQQAQAQAAVDQAKALLGQAEALWESAASLSARTLRELADDAPQRSLWEKIADAFRAFVEFLVSTVMEWIVTVLDVLATLASFIFPPLGSAIGFLAGGLDVIRAAVGGDSAEIAMAVGGMALGLVPGGRLAKRVVGAVVDGATSGTVRGGVAAAARGVAGGAGRTASGTIPAPTTLSRNRPPVPRNTAVSLDLRKCVTDPVDVATGEMVLSRVDVDLPFLERTHVSSYRAGGLFGPTWASTLDQRLELDAEGACYFAADGMILVYPTAEPGTPVMPVEGPRLPLTMLPEARAELHDPATGRTLHFRIGGATAPLEAIEERGTRITVERDGNGLPTVLRHSSGPAVAITTDGARVTALHRLDGAGLPAAPLARYGYDPDGRLVEAGNASGRPEGYSYDDAGRITGWRDRNGVAYRYTYDSEGRCIATDGDRGFLSATFTYDRERRVTRFTDSLGHVRTYELDEWHHTIREIDPLGGATTFVWDRHHRLLARTDALGGTTRYVYADDAANLVRIIRADGSVVDVPPRHATGTAVTLTADQDAVSERPVPEPLRPGLLRTDVPSRNLPRDPAAAGGVVSRRGRHGAAEQLRYDDEGNPVERSDAAGQVTRYEYGAFDLVTAVVEPTGARTEYEYDTELRMLGVTDPRGLRWRYGYDPAGRLVEESDFDGRVLRFTYDAAGTLATSTNGLGEVCERVRDPLGTVVERRTPTGTTTYTYDPFGRLLSAVDGESELVIERDEHGRVVAQTTNGARVSFDYDAAGRAVHRRTPSGAHSTWHFDAAGRPATLTLDGHRTDFRHDAAGHEVDRQVDGVPVLRQAFGGEGWLTEQELPGIGRRRFDRRADGELLRVRDDAAGTTEFTLDPVGRVLAVTAPHTRESYRYDPAGNLIATDVAGTHICGELRYAANRVLTAGPVRYGYDAQGRTTTRTVTDPVAGDREWTYTWDALDRLTGVRTPDGERWRYGYDPLGRRISKQRLASTGDERVLERVDFVWDGAVLVEQVHTDADGHRHVTTWEHHPGTEHPVAQSERLGAAGDDRRFSSVVTDAVGTATELLGSDGAAVWQHRASLWGVPLDDAGPDATPLRFPGQYLDAETGLHYNVFRYYDPVTGRYLSQDPLGLAPAPNPVAYVANPLSAADPLGLAPTTGGCGGAGGAGGTPARPGSTDDVDRVRDTRSDRGTPNGSEEAPAAPGEGTSRPDAERSDSPERSDDSVDTPQGEPAPVRHPALDQPFNPNPPRPDFVYHGSSIEDKVIFKSGILSPAALKGIQPDYNLPEYVRNPKDKHGFVSTTDNFDVALQFIRGTPDGPRKTANDGIFDKYFSGKTPETFQQRKGWVYAIDTRPIKGQPEMPLIHVPSQNVAERFKYQDEWATLDRVPPERITGAYRIDGFFTPKATPEGRVKIDVYKGEDTKTLNKGFIPRDINEFNL